MALSIQNRLTVGLVTMLTFLLLAQWLLVSVAIKYLVVDLVETRLEHDVESLLGAVVFDNQGKPSLTSLKLNAVYQTPLSGHYYQIISNGYQLRSRSLWDTVLAVDPVAVGAAQTTQRTGPAQQHLLVLARGYMKGGYAITIEIAEDLALARQHIQQLQRYYAFFSLTVIILLLLIQRRIIKQALIPLERVREELTQLERGQAVTMAIDPPQEIAPLVEQINHLLGVMGKRLQRSRKAAGNLAHGLKAPLTVLLQQADVPAVKQDEQTANTIRSQTQAIRQLVDRELKRARLAGGEPGYRTKLQDELGPLMDTLQRIYPDKAFDIEIDIPADASPSMDRLDMLEMLGNLLDNAYKFARSKIHIQYASNGGELWIVEDDGPGCFEHELERLMKRGTRLDEKREGHGLGLAIVQDIVLDYGGDIALLASPELGGLKVEINMR